MDTADTTAPPAGWQQPMDRGRAARRQVMLRAGLVLLLLVMLARLPFDEPLTRLFRDEQDIPVALGILALLAIFAIRPATRLPGITVPAWARPVWVQVAGLAVAIVMVGYIGHYALLQGHALSRDEQMALFDAEIFRSGRIVARIPAEWQHFFPALNTVFMPATLDGSGWISIYRPINSCLHALAAMAGDTAWANPVLGAVGLVATWRVACRIFPGDTGSQTVTLVLFATSAQVLTLGMTSYAMPALLALNMVWLALFLTDRWYGYLGAIAVGFFATGVHQLAYHPLFAGPILFFLLVVRKRWAWSAVFAVAYAAIIYFWTRYTAFAVSELGLRPVATDGDTFLLTRLLWALQSISFASLWMQSGYLLRFIAWDNALLLPLVIAGVPAALRSRDLRVVALVASIATLIVVKLILSPYQGHGWGYRYIHGWVGVIAIVGATGWRALRDKGAITRGDLIAATAVTLLVFVPFQWWHARHFSEMYAGWDRGIAASNATTVVVEDYAPGFVQDIVYNPPDVDRRPVRLRASALTQADMAELCRRGPVGFIDAAMLSPIATRFGQSMAAKDQALPKLRRAAAAMGCSIVPISRQS